MKLQLLAILEKKEKKRAVISDTSLVVLTGIVQ